MAFVRMDHVPETVKVNLPLYLILPDPKQAREQPLSERKVLYLLHGLGDDGSAWLRYTAIETIASRYGLVVVMPSAGRSFYTDMPNGQKYFTYIMEELPRYLKDLFGLAPRRENTFLAGNSMGGYGALKAALLHPGHFAAVACFSGVLSLDFLTLYPNDPRRPEFETLLGDLNQLSGGPHDPAVWLRRAAQHPQDLPRLFISCGRQEDLYPVNVMFAAACRELGVPIEYHEEDAQHDWIFWDREIRRFLAAVLEEKPR